MEKDMTARPKKVLTEAQRLAFLKGREKRMANVEKRRLEKLELAQVEAEVEPVAMPEVKPAPAPVPEVKPEPQPEAKAPPPPTLVIDENKIAERVASLVVERMPKKRAYTVKPKPAVAAAPPPPPSPPRVQTFSWM